MRNLYTLDDGLVESTKADRATAPLSTLFDDQYFGRYNQDTYRPVATLSTILDHRVGIDPRHAGHAQNILWHAVTALLVVVFASLVLPLPAATVAGLFFAVHPVASEATVSIGWREDGIVAALIMAALVLTWRGGPVRRALALLVYMLALFTKENAIVFPVLLVLGRLTLERERPVDWRAVGRELAAFGVITAGYLAIRFGVMASPEVFADPRGGTYADTLVAVPRIFAHDVRFLLAPWPQLVLYAHLFPLGASFVSQLPWLFLDLSLVAAALWLARARPVMGFGVLWFMIALVPMLHFAPMRVTAADRFIHVSLVGGAFAAGALFELAQAAAPSLSVRRIVQACSAVALFGLLILTERRIRVWHDDLSLWSDTLRHNPRAYLGHFYLAAHHEAEGRPDRARKGFESAVADCPRESHFGRTRFCAYFASKLGYLLLRGSDLPGARAAFEESLGFASEYSPALIGLGHVCLAEGDVNGARRYAGAATASGARMPVIRSMLDSLVEAIDQTAPKTVEQ